MEVTTTAIIRGKEIVDLVFDLTGNKGFIAGGFARYCVSRLESPIIPGDIDIFCETPEVFDDILKRFNSHKQMKRRSQSPIEVKFEYENTSGFHRDCYTIQLIRPINASNMVAVGTPKTILENFDFTISRVAIVPDDGLFMVPNAICDSNFHMDDADKKLVIQNIHCPISSCKRVIKYVQKGFTIDSAELLKLFKDYENRSPEWKQLITDGLEGILDDEDTHKFTQAMYMD